MRSLQILYVAGGNRPVTQVEQDANNLSNVIATLGDSAFFSVNELLKDLEQHKKSPLLSVSNDGTIGENPTRGTDSNGFKHINNFPSTSEELIIPKKINVSLINPRD